MSPLGIIFLTQLVFILLGMVISWVGIVFLTIPIFVPIVVQLGFDSVWFGVLFSMNMQMACKQEPYNDPNSHMIISTTQQIFFLTEKTTSYLTEDG